MSDRVTELEKILNSELEVFSKLESFLVDKKTYLIKGDIEKIKQIDTEIEKQGFEIKKTGNKRNEVISGISGNKTSLMEIIKKVEDKNQASRLLILKEKLNKAAENIEKQNNINDQLIKHSLNLIDRTVNLITNVLSPPTSAYNHSGKIKNNHSGISSIIQDA